MTNTQTTKCEAVIWAKADKTGPSEYVTRQCRNTATHQSPTGAVKVCGQHARYCDTPLSKATV